MWPRAPIRRIAGPDVEVAVVPNGIDNATWSVTPLPRDVGTVTVVSVMRLAPRKRPRHLLKMIHRIHERLPADVRLKVQIIGEGPERASLEKYLRAHDLTDVVELVGRRTRDEIRSAFARADVFVAPANLESFGIAALEARCAGLPVVAMARTGIREFVANGREGLLAQSDRDMVEQLLRLICDPELRQRIATHNREVASNVDWSRVVPANVNVYRRAIELRGAGTARSATA